MFNKNAFANSIAVVTGLIYILFYVIDLIAPAVFEFIFNAQFLGAKVASLIPASFSFGDFISTLVIVIITTWIMGYVWAWFYNRFAK